MFLVPVWCFITDPLYCVECVDGRESLIEIDVNNSDVAYPGLASRSRKIQRNIF